MTDDLYAVKVRQDGMNRWEFAGTDGVLTSRRVHALWFPKEQAERYAAEVRDHGDQAKVVA